MASQAESATSASQAPNSADYLVNISKHGVVPDVIDSIPAASIDVEWAIAGVRAVQGNELKPSQVKSLPKITFDGKSDKLYALLMVDPDAPSRKEPKLREFCHYVVVNIPGSEVAKGDTLIEYIGSGPPLGTGLHRYVYLLYEQKAKVTSNLKISDKMLNGRPGFSAKKFAKDNNLGEPIAANFYQAQYDDYVPILHAQLADRN